MYKTLHKKQGSVTVQLRFARSSVTFCAKRDSYHMRPAKVENLIEEFEKRMDREEYDDAKKALDQLIVILGEKHPQSIALKSEYEIEAEE